MWKSLDNIIIKIWAITLKDKIIFTFLNLVLLDQPEWITLLSFCIYSLVWIVSWQDTIKSVKLTHEFVGICDFNSGIPLPGECEGPMARALAKRAAVSELNYNCPIVRKIF